MARWAGWSQRFCKDIADCLQFLEFDSIPSLLLPRLPESRIHFQLWLVSWMAPLLYPVEFQASVRMHEVSGEPTIISDGLNVGSSIDN